MILNELIKSWTIVINSTITRVNSDDSNCDQLINSTITLYDCDQLFIPECLTRQSQSIINGINGPPKPTLTFQTSSGGWSDGKDLPTKTRHVEHQETMEIYGKVSGEMIYTVVNYQELSIFKFRLSMLAGG